MEELMEFYRESLGARLEAIQFAKKNLTKKRIESIESIKRIAHSLKGSGTTYGFPEITGTAAALEKARGRQFSLRLNELIRIIQFVIKDTPREKVAQILIVDDDHQMTHLLKLKLDSSFREIFIAHSAKDAEEFFNCQNLSLIVLDCLLPDTDGRNLLVKLKENPRTAAIPVFMFSALSGPQAKTECFALGADEFFEKPIDLDTFSAVVAAKLHQTGKVMNALHKDPLTQLLNRMAFIRAYEQISAFSKRSKDPYCLAMLDLDYFKFVNDSYGHAMGDEVLIALSAFFSRYLRKSDIVGRWGGEEFVILFPNTSEKNAKQKLQKLLKIVNEKNFRFINRKPFRVTFSGGMIQVDPQKEDPSLDHSIAKADRLLYKAKMAGRNRIFSSSEKDFDLKMKILIAEDDKPIAQIVKNQLEKEGFHVGHYHDGKSALKAAKKQNFNMAILDVKMPEMDGFNLLQKIRKLPHYKRVPVIILTAMGSKKDILQAIRLGANDFIVKPFSPKQLVTRVWSLMRNYENTCIR